MAFWNSEGSQMIIVVSIRLQEPELNGPVIARPDVILTM